MRFSVQRDPSSIVAAKEALYLQMAECPDQPDRNLTLGLGRAYIDQNPRETVRRRIAWSTDRRAIRGSSLFMSKSVIRETSIHRLGDGDEQVNLSLETRTHHNKRMLVPDFHVPQLLALGRLGFQEEKPTSSSAGLIFEHGTWSEDMAMDDGFTRFGMSSMEVDETVYMRTESPNEGVMMMAERLLALPERPFF